MSQVPPPQTGPIPPPPVGSQQNSHVGTIAKERVRKRTQKQRKYRPPVQIDGDQFDHHFRAVAGETDVNITSQPEFADSSYNAGAPTFQNNSDTVMDHSSSYQSQNAPSAWAVGSNQTAEQVQSQYHSVHRSTYGASSHSLDQTKNDDLLQSQTFEADQPAWNPSSDHQTWNNQETQQQFQAPNWEVEHDQGRYHQDHSVGYQEPIVESNTYQQPQNLQGDTQDREGNRDQGNHHQPSGQDNEVGRFENDPFRDHTGQGSAVAGDDELPWDNEHFETEEQDNWNIHKEPQQESKIGYESQEPPSYFNSQQQSEEHELPWDQAEEKADADGYVANEQQFHEQQFQEVEPTHSDQYHQQHQDDQRDHEASAQENSGYNPSVEQESHQLFQENGEQVETQGSQNFNGAYHYQSEGDRYKDHSGQHGAWQVERNSSFAQSSPRQVPENQEVDTAWKLDSNREPDWLVSESSGQVFEIGNDKYSDRNIPSAPHASQSPLQKSPIFSEEESTDFAELLRQEVTHTVNKPPTGPNNESSHVQNSSPLAETSFENKFSFLEDDDEILEADDVQPYQPQHYSHSIISEPSYRPYQNPVGEPAAPYSEYGESTRYQQYQPGHQSRLDYNQSADISTQTVIRKPVRKSIPSNRYNPGNNSHAGLSTPVPDRTMMYPNILSPAQEFVGHPKLDALEQAKKKTDAYDFPPDMLKTKLVPSNRNLQTVSQNYNSTAYPSLRAASVSTIGTDISFNNIDAQPPKRIVKKKQSFYSELPINNLIRNKPSVHAKDPYAEMESIAYHNRSRSSTIRSSNMQQVPPPPVNPYAPVAKPQMPSPDVNPQTVPVPPPTNMFAPPPPIGQNVGYPSPKGQNQHQFAAPSSNLNPQASRTVDVPTRSTTTNKYAPNISNYPPQPAQQFAPATSSHYTPSLGQQFNSPNVPVISTQGVSQPMISQAGYPTSDQHSVNQFGMQSLHLQTGVGPQGPPQAGLSPISPNTAFTPSNTRGRRARSSISSGMARVKSHNRKISALPPIAQQTAPVVRNPEVYNRTQFPIFHWCRGGKALSMVPKFDTYGQSKLDINIVPNKDVIKIDPLIKSFPGPLTKGKAKQKELIRWIEQKVSSYNNSSDVMSEQKSLLWKILLYSVQNLEQDPDIFNKNLVQILDPQAQLNPDELIDFNALTKSLETASHRRASASSLDPSELAYLYGLLQSGEKQRALSYSIFNRDWAMSLLLASIVAPEKFGATVKLFLKYNFNEHDPVSKKLTFFLSLSNSVDAEDLKQHSTFIIKNFESLLTFILNNKPNPQDILLLIGNTLTEVGFFTYAQIVFAMSGVPLIPNESHVATRDIESIIFNEVYEWIIQNKPNSAFADGIPQLVVMKAVHASILSDIGAVAEAEKYCNYAIQSLKNTKMGANQILLNELQSLSLLLSEAGTSMNTWFGGLSKTNLDKVWGQLDKSFSKFVAGEHLSEDKKVGADVLTFNSSSNVAKIDQPQVHQQLPPFTTQGSANYISPNVYQPAIMSTTTTPDYTTGRISNGSGILHSDGMNNGLIDSSNRVISSQLGYGRESVSKQASQVSLVNNFTASNAKVPSRHVDPTVLSVQSQPGSGSRGQPHMQHATPSGLGLEYPENVSAVNPAGQSSYLPPESINVQQHNQDGVSEYNPYAGTKNITPKMSVPSLNGDSPHRLPLPPHIIDQMPTSESSFNQINSSSENAPDYGHNLSHSRSLQRTQENVNGPTSNQGVASSATPPLRNETPKRIPLATRSSRYAPVDSKGKVLGDSTPVFQKESSHSVDQSNMPLNQVENSWNPNPYFDKGEAASSEMHQHPAKHQEVQQPPVQQQPVQQQPVQPPPVQQQPVQPSPVQQQPVQQPVQQPSVQQQPVQPPPVQQPPVQQPPVQQQPVQQPSVQQQPVQPPPVQQPPVQPPPVQQPPVQQPPVQQPPVQQPPVQQPPGQQQPIEPPVLQQISQHETVQKLEQQDGPSQQSAPTRSTQAEEGANQENHPDGVALVSHNDTQNVMEGSQSSLYEPVSTSQDTLKSPSKEPLVDQQEAPSSEITAEKGNVQVPLEFVNSVVEPETDQSKVSQPLTHVSEPIVGDEQKSTVPSQTSTPSQTNDEGLHSVDKVDDESMHKPLEGPQVSAPATKVADSSTDIPQDASPAQTEIEKSTPVQPPPNVAQKALAGKGAKSRRTRRATSNRYAPNTTHASYLPAETSIDNEATSIQELMDGADANSFSYPGYSVPKAPEKKPGKVLENRAEIQETSKASSEAAESSTQGDISVFRPAHTEDVEGIAPIRAIVEPEPVPQLDQNKIPAFRPPGENAGFSPLSVPTFSDNVSVNDDETFGDEVSDFDGDVSDSDDEETQETGTRRRQSTNKSEKQVKDSKTEKEDSGRWLGWLRSGSDNSKKVYRAKLGEKSTLRYDENLKRYIDTSKPLEEQLEAAAPPPPPPSLKKAGNNPSTSNISGTGIPPPGKHNESSKTEEQSSAQKTGPPPPGQGATPPPLNRGENGTIKPNAGLDDIMAIASSRTAPRAKKRGPRSGYVDIMANSKK